MTALSTSDRSLIDAAIARGQVTRIVPIEPKRGRSADPEVAIRRRKIAAAVADGKTVAQIVDDLDLAPHIVRADMTHLGLKARRGAVSRDKAAEKKRERAARQSEVIKDRRRFRTTPVPFGQPSILTDADATGTIFQSRIFEPGAVDHVLVDGASNSKIGGDVLVGRLKGARIVTLTLEERATCPTSCPLWRGCYGNSMQHSRRLRHGPALEARIKAEVDALCAAHQLVLVRLHVLGDFYSLGYLALWLALLDLHPGLHLFGFTAHRRNTPMGAVIAGLREKHPDRFMVRTSDSTGPWGSFTIDFPTTKHRLGDAAVCPEQRDAMDGGGRGMHCGACGLCWAGSAPIVFVEH